MQADGPLRRYVPLDVSDGTLWEAATALAEEYPGLAVNAVVGDFHRHLDRLPADGTPAVRLPRAAPSATSTPPSAASSSSS